MYLKLLIEIKMEYEDRCRQSQRGKYDCLLFDLDDTLYPLSSGIAIQCRNNIGDYLVEKLGIEENKVSALCNLLYKNYGTTMAGLKAIGYDFDYDDYHSFVHGRLPHENLKPDPVLRQLLLSLPIRKVKPRARSSTSSNTSLDLTPEESNCRRLRSSASHRSKPWSTPSGSPTSIPREPFSLMTACGTFNQGNALGCTLCWWALRTKSKAPTTLWKASITSGKHCPGCGRRPRNLTALGTPARSQWKHRSLLSSSPSSSSIHPSSL
ncbi:uncharacterized protein LOC135622457 isoform X3 [Musa acuminata AAA Group]|uniref:uncharacterized protein LOC135592458 isoform X3 n=1 Tax=Musa acuminata AAA Group TaxID=214697 RepID=UPI0031E2F191